jgi:TolB-like protein/tRNA A-37 threonylcarbamoyl transferase component Bud32
LTSDIRVQLQQALGDAYVLDRELGGGGMSYVFVATERALGRQVVVKLLPAEMSGQVSVERFKREIALAARLQHPHIVPLLSAGDAGGLPYFTMPLIDGESLRARLVKKGELPLNEAVRVLREIASALAYAHERGIVHRDIKPDNVLMSGGSAMITDFGVAKALSASSNSEASSFTSLGVALGTPAYMSPEQASADPTVDYRADIYSFGVLAYELITGQPPFTGRTPQNLLAAHVTETPEHITRRRGAIPPALGQLVMRCLEKRAADRPQSAMDLVHALDQINTPSGGTMPTSAVPAVGAPARASTPTGTQGAKALRRWITIAAVLVVVAVGAWVAATRMKSSSGVGSIAVLPMDTAGDTAHAYLADGLSNELTTRLTKIPGLEVRSYSSSKAMRGRGAGEAGKQLKVASVLTATMNRSGDRLRVTASLVSTDNDAVLWSDTFEANDQDQFGLQDRLVSAIAGALKLKLSPATQVAISARGTQSAQAHDLVQRSRYEVERFTGPSIRQAIALAESAIQLDSTYADAWAALGNAWGELADDFESPRVAVPPMRRAVMRAVQLDPSLAETHAALGTFKYWYEYDVPAAAAELERALQLDSANITAGTLYPTLLDYQKLLDSAGKVARRVMRLNPLSRRPAIWLSQQEAPPDTTRKRCEIVSRLNRNDGINCEARLLYGLGKRAEAIARIRQLIGPESRGGDHTNLANALISYGDTVGARKELALAVEAYKREYVREDFIAGDYYRLGDRERAIEWWQKSADSNGSQIVVLANSEYWAEFRKDLRVQAILKKAGAIK